jgi:hypothetical protein
MFDLSRMPGESLRARSHVSLSPPLRRCRRGLVSNSNFKLLPEPRIIFLAPFDSAGQLLVFGTNCAQFRVGKVRILGSVGPAQEAGPPPSVRLSNQNRGITFWESCTLLRFSPSPAQQASSSAPHSANLTQVGLLFWIELTTTLCLNPFCLSFVPAPDPKSGGFLFLLFSGVPFAAPPICPHMHPLLSSPTMLNDRTKVGFCVRAQPCTRLMP